MKRKLKFRVKSGILKGAEGHLKGHSSYSYTIELTTDCGAFKKGDVVNFKKYELEEVKTT